MKINVIIFLLCLVSACASQTSVKEPAQSPMPTVSEMPAQVPDKPLLPLKTPLKPLFGKILSEISLSKSSFNPSQGEEIALSYTLLKPAKVTVNIYDPDLGLINTIPGQKTFEPGKQIFIWDGKDTDGNVVPDEAYFFTLIADDDSGAQEIYDPTTFSGGEEHDITKADIDPQNHTITYKMPEMGRVMIRMGIQGGPLMNQLVDWKPRVKGMITEYWNGKDTDNLVDIYRHPKFKMIVSYFSLPENSVITYGNKTSGFRNYKNTVALKRPLKPKRPTSISRLSHHYKIPRTIDYSPELTIELTNVQGKDNKGLPILRGKTLVKVALNEKDKAIFQNHQFEICFFLDHEFYAEDEAGYTPFNWVWDLSNVEEGEHLLTVNISSFKDQIGVLSRKVRVVK